MQCLFVCVQGFRAAQYSVREMLAFGWIINRFAVAHHNLYTSFHLNNFVQNLIFTGQWDTKNKSNYWICHVDHNKKKRETTWPNDRRRHNKQITTEHRVINHLLLKSTNNDLKKIIRKTFLVSLFCILYIFLVKTLIRS